MKCSNFIFVAAVFTILFFHPTSILASRNLSQPQSAAEDHSQPTRAEETVGNPNLYKEKRVKIKREGADPLEIAGSGLPDCSHACGSCSPCRLVMVSFVCASLQEAPETCPMAYKCMCNNKAYPVP